LPRTLEWLRRLGVPERDAPDVAQTVWLRVCRSLPGRDPERPFAPWLWTIAYHAACEQLGRAYVRHEQLSASGDLIDEAALPAVENAMDARTLLPLVMRRLSPEHQAVFLMIEVEQFTFAEVAQALDIPIGTVQTRLRRAQQEVASALKRIQAAERRRSGAAVVLPALWMDWRTLVEQARGVPEVPQELADRIWAGVLRQIAADGAGGTIEERSEARERPEPPRAPSPAGSRPDPLPPQPSRARRGARAAGLFLAGAITGGTLVYWLSHQAPAASPSSAATPLPAQGGTAHGETAAQLAAAASPSASSAGTATSPSASSAGTATSPSTLSAGTPASPSTRAAASPRAVQGARAPAEDFRPALAALEAARVLAQSGRCAEATERLRPHAATLAGGPYAVPYRDFLRRLQECER
jgi:RNA polymerase sigma-70 factor (ECF subfamily)